MVDLAADEDDGGTIKIADGRHHYRICRELGYAVRFRTLAMARGELADYVAHRNVNRRHVTPSQRAAALARLNEFRNGGDRGNQHTGGRVQNCTLPNPTQERAAKAAKISRRTLSHATKVGKKAPELLDSVRDGYDYLFGNFVQPFVKAMRRAKNAAWDRGAVGGLGELAKQGLGVFGGPYQRNKRRYGRAVATLAEVAVLTLKYAVVPALGGAAVASLAGAGAASAALYAGGAAAASVVPVASLLGSSAPGIVVSKVLRAGVQAGVRGVYGQGDVDEDARSRARARLDGIKARRKAAQKAGFLPAAGRAAVTAGRVAGLGRKPNFSEGAAGPDGATVGAEITREVAARTGVPERAAAAMLAVLLRPARASEAA